MVKPHLIEGLRFIIVGILSVFTDMGFYYLFTTNGFQVNLSKLISFVLGAILGFIMNKSWTFRSKGNTHKEILMFAVLYFISLNANVFSNKWILDSYHLKLLAFIVATGISTIINYLGQKFIVFRKV